MKKTIRIGTRDSILAVWQAEMIKDKIAQRYPDYQIDLVPMKTTADKILDKTLEQIGGKGLFLKELDKALLAGEIDISVHSLKDVPGQIDERLPLLAYAERADCRDVLVLPDNKSVLDKNLPLGSAGPRRQVQLAELFPDMKVAPVRGNVQTRLRKLDEGQYSALILAYAGLLRLGLGKRASRVFEVEEMLPAAGQGIVVVQGRADEDYSYLQDCDNKQSRIMALAERSFIKALNGGCTTPIAAHCRLLEDNQISLTGLYVDQATGRQYRGSLNTLAQYAEDLGDQLTEKLLRQCKGV